jgi:hypothetical protein
MFQKNVANNEAQKPNINCFATQKTAWGTLLPQNRRRFVMKGRRREAKKSNHDSGHDDDESENFSVINYEELLLTRKHVSIKGNSQAILS